MKITFNTTKQVVKDNIARILTEEVTAEVVGTIEDWREPVTVARHNSMTFAVVDGYGIWCMQPQAKYNPDPIDVVRRKGENKVLVSIQNIQFAIA